jgi:predicted N-acetyltransferase YhbS
VSLEIRDERPGDREASLAVERVAFDTDEEAAIVAAVCDEEGSFALVAEEDREIVGHAQFTRAWIGGDAVVALGPMAVVPERQGGGIGSGLVRAGLQRARERREPAVIVLGDPGFYPRFGFVPASDLGLRNPFAGVQQDGFVIREQDFMVAVMDERARVLRGEVRWHPAFGQGG